MDPIIWAFVLVLCALTLGALEMFIPSGGILAFLSLSALVAAVVMAFLQSPTYGVTFFVAIIILIPISVWGAVRWWPETPIGRRILLDAAKPEEVLPDTSGFKCLVGCHGVATTKMLPSGAVKIDGRSYTAYSESVAITAGTPVEVVKVEGTQILVRPVSDLGASESRAGSQAGESPSADDILSQPIESFGLDIKSIEE